MNMRLAPSHVVIEFAGRGEERLEDVGAGVRLAYDADRKIVAVDVPSAPWVEVIGARGGADREYLAGAALRYDEEVDALIIDVARGAYRDSEELLPGLIVDLDAEERVIGLEFLGASTFFSGDAMTEIRRYAIPSTSGAGNGGRGSS